MPKEPKGIKLIIVAESPPASDLYFYKPGKVTEPLFAAMMKQLGFECSEKEHGLQHFKQCGWVLVDATYEPVNKCIRREECGRLVATNEPCTKSCRNKIIDRDYRQLRCDLLWLTPNRSAPLVLINENVCQILEPKLRDEFNVLNQRTVIPFPSNSWQTPRRDGKPSFAERFAAVVPRELYPTKAS